MENDKKRARENDDLESLSRPISPPPKRPKNPEDETGGGHDKKRSRDVPMEAVSSPWEMTWIRDLPENHNRHALTLADILGDPLVSECWIFNYLHDVPFIMDAFDQDTRHLVKVHIVHGFWKQEDPSRLRLGQEASQFKNVELHVAPMPEMFGTHHSKMMILFRHDDTAQVIIHTANMISKDWTNMTNAVWRSPPLPRLVDGEGLHDASMLPNHHALGTGQRFKSDLVSYLRNYNRRKPICRSLIGALLGYDFSSVRAALVASVPGRHNIHDPSEPAWGWTALKQHLSKIPVRGGNGSTIVIQISSIATLGATDEWLRKTLLETLSRSASADAGKPEFKIVFPTADEIRRSLDGYGSGGSIHTKIQSQQQIKQLQYLRPMLYHWANDSPGGKALPEDATRHDGKRARAAPHVKTYIRYNNQSSIDWALLTSANLSKQAWGEASRQPAGEVRIASWEIGVLVWPELLSEGSTMVPIFEGDDADGVDVSAAPQVGVRIPYSLPLQKYGLAETPWVASINHTEPDRFGSVWMG